jgi:hypothetical protein
VILYVVSSFTVKELKDPLALFEGSFVPVLSVIVQVFAVIPVAGPYV